MKKPIVALVLLLGLANCQTAQEEKSNHVVLPNPKLLRCKSAECFQLWSESPSEGEVFPKQVTVDVDHGCLYAVRASYDKSVPFDEIKAAINENYGKWALNQFGDSRMKLWRVEPDQFAINLNVADKKDEKMNIAEAGTKQVYFIAFSGSCNLH